MYKPNNIGSITKEARGGYLKMSDFYRTIFV